MVWIYILIFIGSCLLLVKSGTWVVRSLIRIARTLEWSQFLVSFLLMAFATSLPEFFVGLSSAFHKVPQLSFGNIIGANILNLTLGVGIAALVAGGLKLETQVARRDALYTALCSFLPLLLMLDGSCSRIDGIILLGILVFYLKIVFQEKQKFTKVLKDKFRKNWTQFKLFLQDLAIFFGSVVLLLAAGEGVVRSAQVLASKMNFPLILTGIIFVSLGTTLPEMTFGLRSISLGYKEMVLGNLMGSVIINSTLILGLVSLISPLKITNLSPYLIGILFTSIVAFTFVIFARTGQKITKKEALILLGIYVLFIVFQLLIK